MIRSGKATRLLTGASLLSLAIVMTASGQITSGPAYNPYGRNTAASYGTGVTPGIPTVNSGGVLMGRMGLFGPPMVISHTPYGYVTTPFVPGLNQYYGAPIGLHYGTPQYGNSYMQGATSGSTYPSQSQWSPGYENQPAAPKAKAAPKKVEAPAAPAVNRRKLFDQFMDANIQRPKAEDVRQAQQRALLIRSLTSPSTLEITSGSALNVLVESILTAPKPLAETRPVPFEEAMIRQLNFARTTGSGSMGLLRSEGAIPWPASFRSLASKDEVATTLKKIEETFREAYQQIEVGKADPETLKLLQQTIDTLSQHISANAFNLGINEGLEAKRFIRSLEDTILFMKQPDAGDWLPGKCKAKPKSVQELITLLAQKNIRFAPAVVGNDAAYMQLHRELGRLHQELYPEGPGK